MTMTDSDFDQVSHMCTIFAVGICRGHNDSQLSLKNGIASSQDLEGLLPAQKEERAYRQAMDWIGNCFVQTNYGDVIAIATTIDKSTTPHQITFHISNNIGKERKVKSKKAIWPDFLDIMNKIKLLDPSKPEDLNKGSQMYVGHIISKGWSRVVQKFGAIQNISSEMEIMFTDLHKKLCAQHCITLQDISLAYGRDVANTNTDKIFLENGIKKFREDMSALLAVTRKSRSNTTTKATVDVHLKIFYEGVAISRPVLSVINSILKRYDPETAEIWKENQDLKKFILKMHNRLSRLLKFESGAKVFVQKCLGIYQKFASLTSKSELHFEVAWVEDYVEDGGLPNVKIPDMYANVYLNKLEEIKNRLFAGDSEMLKSATYDKVCELATKHIEKKASKKLELAPSLHCEISLAFYLEARKLDPLYNFIGVTKLNCSSCTHYSESYFKVRDLQYEMTGSSGKWQHNWFMPLVPAIRDADPHLLETMRSDMTDVRNQVLGYAELALKNILSREDLPGSSVGSDSTTGSMNPILLQEVYYLV